MLASARTAAAKLPACLPAACLPAYMERLRGRVAVVTGAGSGIGRELCLQLIAAGAHVAACDVKTDTLEVTRRLCERLATSSSFYLSSSPSPPPRISTHLCDVTSVDQIESFRAAVERTHGSVVHLLCNNAGLATSGSFAKMSRDRFNRIFDVSFKGTVECTRAFLPMLIRADAACIVNLSSVNAFWCCMGPTRWPIQMPPHAPYSAAKAAVRAFSEALMQDARQNFPHVNVCCVHPGHIGTNIASSAVYTDLGGAVVESDVARIRASLSLSLDGVDAMSPEELYRAAGDKFRDRAPTSARDCAVAIVGAVRSGKTRVLVGEDAHVLDWLSRMFPRLIYNDLFMTIVLLPWIILAPRVPLPAPLGRVFYPAILVGLGMLAGRWVFRRLGAKPRL